MDRVYIKEFVNKRIESSLKIGVFDSRFVSLCIAEALEEKLTPLGKRVTFIEISDSNQLIYDMVGMDKRFLGRQLCPQDTDTLRGVRNIEAGINWLIRLPKDPAPTDAKALRLIAGSSGEVLICSFKGRADQYQESLKLMDSILTVVDPLPSKLIPRADEYSFLRSLDSKWLINHNNKGVNERQLLSFLRQNKVFRLPEIPKEEIYKAEYTCKLPLEYQPIRRAIMADIEALLSAIMGV